jgi:hypothetical protein
MTNKYVLLYLLSDYHYSNCRIAFENRRELKMTSISTGLFGAPNLLRKGVNVLVCGALAFTLMACEDNVDHRQDRRDDRQDCRQDEGLVGGDKRDCKQDERSESPEPAV